MVLKDFETNELLEKYFIEVYHISERVEISSKMCRKL